jgi:hypothetical protein
LYHGQPITHDALYNYQRYDKKRELNYRRALTKYFPTTYGFQNWCQNNLKNYNVISLTKLTYGLLNQQPSNPFKQEFKTLTWALAGEHCLGIDDINFIYPLNVIGKEELHLVDKQCKRLCHAFKRNIEQQLFLKYTTNTPPVEEKPTRTRSLSCPASLLREPSIMN